MNERAYALFGLIGPLIAYLLIAVSIMLSPRFSWSSSALSDLGHSVTSDVAPLYNFGLLIAGFCITIYSVTAMRKHAKYTSHCLLLTGLVLQLVATFDEVYGSLHFAVSILFFGALGLTSITYALEKRSVVSLMAFITGLSAWVLYFGGMYNAGVVVPETISSVVTVSPIMASALKIYLGKEKG